jgi:hypothetical protein
VSASINPHRVMIAFTSEQRMPQQTSSWLSKLSREAVSTVETAQDETTAGRLIAVRIDQLLAGALPAAARAALRSATKSR